MRYLLFFFCVFSFELIALLDLDKMEAPFILETKRIHIPDYPDAFNPSIVKWENRVLMSFRIRDPLTKKTNQVGFTWLDEKLNPVGTPQLLTIDENIYIQDPRLFVIGKKLFMAFSDLFEDPKTHIKNRKMCMTEILHDGVRFFAFDKDCYHKFDGDTTNKFEKNWVPFEYEGLMLLSYTLSPHKVFLPMQGENRCVTVALNDELGSWIWGELRGGTPAILIDHHYLAFFHSSISMKTAQSGGQSMVHYFMGAYLFENKPPFSIKKISPNPIVGKTFYNGPTHQTWKPLRVVFPCGIIHDQDFIWVSYGRQDHEAWIVKFDKAGLYKSLLPFP